MITCATSHRKVSEGERGGGGEGEKELVEEGPVKNKRCSGLNHWDGVRNVAANWADLQPFPA